MMRSVSGLLCRYPCCVILAHFEPFSVFWSKESYYPDSVYKLHFRACIYFFGSSSVIMALIRSMEKFSVLMKIFLSMDLAK
jgi:hypothetical protein